MQSGKRKPGVLKTCCNAAGESMFLLDVSSVPT